MDHYLSTKNTRDNNSLISVLYNSSSSSSFIGVKPKTGNSNNNNNSQKKKNSKKILKLSTDPQSVAARERRHRISDRFKILQSMVPGAGTGGNGAGKMDTVAILDEAIRYVSFLKAQIRGLNYQINPSESTMALDDVTRSGQGQFCLFRNGCDISGYDLEIKPSSSSCTMAPDDDITCSGQGHFCLHRNGCDSGYDLEVSPSSSSLMVLDDVTCFGQGQSSHFGNGCVSGYDFEMAQYSHFVPLYDSCRGVQDS